MQEKINNIEELQLISFNCLIHGITEKGHSGRCAVSALLIKGLLVIK